MTKSEALDKIHDIVAALQPFHERVSALRERGYEEKEILDYQFRPTGVLIAPLSEAYLNALEIWGMIEEVLNDD